MDQVEVIHYLDRPVQQASLDATGTGGAFPPHP